MAKKPESNFINPYKTIDQSMMGICIVDTAAVDLHMVCGMKMAQAAHAAVISTFKDVLKWTDGKSADQIVAMLQSIAEGRFTKYVYSVRNWRELYHIQDLAIANKITFGIMRDWNPALYGDDSDHPTAIAIGPVTTKRELDLVTGYLPLLKCIGDGKEV